MNLSGEIGLAKALSAAAAFVEALDLLRPRSGDAGSVILPSSRPGGWWEMLEAFVSGSRESDV